MSPTRDPSGYAERIRSVAKLFHCAPSPCTRALGRTWEPTRFFGRTSCRRGNMPRVPCVAVLLCRMRKGSRRAANAIGPRQSTKKFFNGVRTKPDCESESAPSNLHRPMKCERVSRPDSQERSYNTGRHAAHVNLARQSLQLGWT